MTSPSTRESAEVRRRLEAEAAQAAETVTALEREYEDLLRDPGVIQEDRDAHRMVLERAREAARHAEEALVRAAEGSYGRCRHCGAEIPPERLEAIPDADSCVACAR